MGIESKGAAVTAVLRIGRGAWKLSKRMQLATSPHQGDQIVVGDDVITCEQIRIWPDFVEVLAPHEPVNPDNRGHYMKAGWSADV